MQHADLVADRRRLKRSLSFWRVGAIFVAALSLIGLIAIVGGEHAKPRGNHIASIPFKGVILDDARQLKLVRQALEDDNVVAVILEIDSPGGAVTGSEMLYRELASLSGQKPVVSVFRTLGTSAAYAIALPGERLFAQRTSIIGSIGVIFQWAEVSELLQSWGVEMQTVKSAPLKSEPQPFRPTTPEAIAMIERLVQGSLDWFVEIVEQNRPFDAATARRLSNGAVYTGEEALRLQLIDEIGGMDEAKAWLIAEKGLDENLRVIELKQEEDSFFGGLKISLNTFSDLIGVSIQSKSVSPQWGLMAIWSPRLLQ